MRARGLVLHGTPAHAAPLPHLDRENRALARPIQEGCAARLRTHTPRLHVRRCTRCLCQNTTLCAVHISTMAAIAQKSAVAGRVQGLSLK
jgi:hypothetical protein